MAHRLHVVKQMRTPLLRFGGFVLFTAVLWAAQEVLVPLALAVLLAFLLAPGVRTLERWLPRAVAVTIVVVLGFSGLAGFGWILGRQVTNLAQELPGYRQNIRERVAEIRGAGRGGALENLKSTAEEVKEELGKEADSRPAERARPVVVREAPRQLWSLPATGRPFIEALATAGLVIALVAFMLARRLELRSRLLRVIGERRVPVAMKMIDEATDRVSHYLVSLAIVNTMFGFAVGLGLAAVGVPYAALWGALAGALRFIAYVGVWVAALLPIALSLAVFPGWTKPLMTIAVFAILEPLVFLVAEPLIYRRTVGVSDVGLLQSAA